MRAPGEPSDRDLALHLAGGTVAEARRLGRLVGRGVDWLELPVSRWRDAGWPGRWVKRLRPWRNREALAHERASARARGIELVGLRGRAYPACLRELPDAPLALCVRGRWPPPERAVAIVGARAATLTGRRAAGHLGEVAAETGVAVVSGLARGVDSCALQATLDAGGWAVGVLGCGIDVIYPPENGELQEAIAQRGTLLSEFPLGTRPDRWTFPRRNRLIAALAQQTLVVEAGKRSGALITAGYALELGREVWAVPGAVDSPQSRGSNQLLFDGAQPVVEPGALPELLGHGAPAERQASAVVAGEEDPVLSALGGRALTADELAEITTHSTREIRSRLIGLELQGRVIRTAGGRYITA